MTLIIRVSHKIHLYLSKIDGKQPHVRLDLQDHIENIDYKWLTIEELEQYMGKTTTNLRKAYDESQFKTKYSKKTSLFS